MTTKMTAPCLFVLMLGLSSALADETGDKRILDQRITGYRTRVKSFYTVGGGAFLTGPSDASIFTEPQHAAMYKGRYICFRCKETDNPYPPLKGAR